MGQITTKITMPKFSQTCSVTSRLDLYKMGKLLIVVSVLSQLLSKEQPIQEMLQALLILEPPGMSLIIILLSIG